VALEARKVIASRYDDTPSGADVLDEPVVVVRAVGTTVVPVGHRRGPPRSGPGGLTLGTRVDRAPDRRGRGTGRRSPLGAWLPPPCLCCAPGGASGGRHGRDLAGAGDPLGRW